MKTAIKLVLINLLIAQIIAPILVMIPVAIYLFITTGRMDQGVLMHTVLIPALLFGQLMMAVYLWKGGYINTQKVNWSPISTSFLFYSTLSILACAFLVSALMSHLKWIPDIMEQTFDFLQSGWLGIFTIVIAGPILEEVLFRGAITKALLQQYNPTKAIIISGAIFGVFHLNPAQILPAFLIGILFAWSYYKTKSLIPCILMHVVNNGLSVFLSIKYPEVKCINEFFTDKLYITLIIVAALLLISTILRMQRETNPYNEDIED